jgi:hypothetical protein
VAAVGFLATCKLKVRSHLGPEVGDGDTALTALALHVAGHPLQGELVQQALLLGAQAQGLGEEIPQEVH